ncbi:uncharacterized protein ACHE_31176A [Aspergillus chevalieri]|uniref:DUF7907 domain-containing protein n=1 Tax=Aspergillus chevalieri TaxID=182096 RepID=A0A7R7VNI2_ASPCH|nr:uncharacterized protein ACHE_31176A [Aspergillus chevalieri]BCR87189.1 hypothetical protein ACHE_31176A [Aspergillus chevalieri]
MKLLTSLTTTLLATAATASPLISRASSDEAITTKKFHLKTTASDASAHNNLYVYAYHTGAGLNDAVLSANADDASKAFVNGTNVQFDLGTPFPWGVNMVGATNYGAWQPVQINTGYGTSGFELDNAHLKWSEQNGFGGWLVCDWVHNAPQLFYLYEPIKADVPSSCSKVELQAVYL